MKKVISLLLVTALFVSICAILCGCDSDNSNGGNYGSNYNGNSNSNINNNSSTSGNSSNSNPNVDSGNNNVGDESNLNFFDFYGLKIALDKSYTKTSENRADSMAVISFENNDYTIRVTYGPGAPDSATGFADSIYSSAASGDQKGSTLSRGSANGTPWIARILSDGQVSGVSSFYVKNDYGWMVDIYTNNNFSGNLNDMIDCITGWKFT